METDNKLYNPKSEIDKNRVLIILDEIIYPKSFKEIVNGIDFKKKEFEFNLFLKDSYVWVITLHDTNKERLSETTEIFVKNIWGKIVNFKKVIICDGQEFMEELNNVKEKINNGVNETIFHEWFMNLAIQLSQMKHPINSNGGIKKNYLPKCEVVEIEHKGEEYNLYSNYIFISSEGNLLIHPYISDLIKKVDKKIQKKYEEKISKKKLIKKRNPLDSKLRHEVFKRDGYKCVECGAINKEKTLHCDHIISVSQGGTDEMDNLQTLCDDCNLAKSDKCWKGNLNGVGNG